MYARLWHLSGPAAALADNLPFDQQRGGQIYVIYIYTLTETTQCYVENNLEIKRFQYYNDFDEIRKSLLPSPTAATYG